MHALGIMGLPRRIFDYPVVYFKFYRLDGLGNIGILFFIFLFILSFSLFPVYPAYNYYFSWIIYDTFYDYANINRWIR